MSREDFGSIKRQGAANNRAAVSKRAVEANKISGQNGDTSTVLEQDGRDAKDETGSNPGNPTSATSANGTMPPPAPAPAPGPRQPWELVEEVTLTLKTAFPLLALSMEKMVDQISLRAKPSSDEDIYRFFAALLADALQVSAFVLTVARADFSSNGVVEVVCLMTMESSAQ